MNLAKNIEFFMDVIYGLLQQPTKLSTCTVCTCTYIHSTSTNKNKFFLSFYFCTQRKLNYKKNVK